MSAGLQTATACLGDLCDMLHCDWFATAVASSHAKRNRRRRKAPHSPNSMMRDENCMPHEAARTRSACQELAQT